MRIFQSHRRTGMTKQTLKLRESGSSHFMVGVRLKSATDRHLTVSVGNFRTILVGHSQGGALITQATNRCSKKIQGLIYIAAVVPDSGTSAFADLSSEDEEWFSKCAELNKSRKVWKLLANAPLHEAFMSELSTQEANKYKSLFVDEPSLIGEEILHYNEDVFRQIPKIYIETVNDRIITLATQRRIQAKRSWTGAYSIFSSHSPYFSHPVLLSKAITDSSILINRTTKTKKGYL